jgi:hypothetical protein
VAQALIAPAGAARRTLTSSVPGDREPTSKARLRRALLVTLLLLLVQFCLGIGTNLYVAIPAHHSGAHPHNYLSGSARSLGWALAHGPVVLVAHTLLGLILALSGLGVVVQALRCGRRLLSLALLGWATIIGAGFNGASFLDFLDTISSLIMALLFALSVLAYLVMLYLAPGDSTSKARIG